MGKFGRSHTKREETRMKTEADTGVKLRLERCGCQPGNPRIASDPRRTKRDRKGPLSEPESLALPTPRSWTFGLQTCERPHFCCLKLPVLRYFCFGSHRKFIQLIERVVRPTPYQKPVSLRGVLASFWKQLCSQYLLGPPITHLPPQPPELSDGKSFGPHLPTGRRNGG